MDDYSLLKKQFDEMSWAEKYKIIREHNISSAITETRIFWPEAMDAIKTIVNQCSGKHFCLRDAEELEILAHEIRDKLSKIKKEETV